MLHEFREIFHNGKILEHWAVGQMISIG
jgi:predicted ester cyclase